MKRILAVLAASFAVLAWAQSSEVAKPDSAVESRLKAISEELRCLVCQNQTIADSHATLAVDLRQQIRTMVGAGKSDAEIREYMVQRYGDFVLYKPPFQANTLLLWLGPAILIAAGAVILVVTIRRRRAMPVPAPAGAATSREIESLLAGNDPASETKAPVDKKEKKKGGRGRP